MQCPVYFAATILHPQFRLAGMRKTAPAIVDQAEIQFKRFLHKYWAKDSPDSISEASSAQGIHSQADIPPTFTTSFMEEVDEETSAETMDEEYQRYLSLPRQTKRDVNGKPIAIDPIAWWQGRRVEFPILSKMALDVLSIPAVSAECERVFSQGKLTMTSQRHRMSATTLELLLCLKNWLRNGFTMGPAEERKADKANAEKNTK